LATPTTQSNKADDSSAVTLVGNGAALSPVGRWKRVETEDDPHVGQVNVEGVCDDSGDGDGDGDGTEGTISAGDGGEHSGSDVEVDDDDATDDGGGDDGDGVRGNGSGGRSGADADGDDDNEDGDNEDDTDDAETSDI
jgi:hypothetical protein